MREVDPGGGVPGLGRVGEEGVGGGGWGLQVAWHGGVPCLGLGLAKLAQVDLSSCTACTNIMCIATSITVQYQRNTRDHSSLLALYNNIVVFNCSIASSTWTPFALTTR